MMLLRVQHTTAQQDITSPTSTGWQNWISSMLQTWGQMSPFTNMQAQSHPIQTASLMMNPPNILPWRFMSCRCISMVFWSRVELIERYPSRKRELRCYKKTSWIILDQSPEGGDESRDLVLRYFLFCCLYQPRLCRIFIYLSSDSKVIVGTLNFLPTGSTFLFLPTITNVALQLRAPSCWTSIHTSTLLLPTQVTYPENIHYFVASIDLKKSIWSTAAVTKQQSLVARSSQTVSQYLLATLAAIQSMTSMILPNLTPSEQNLTNLCLSSGERSKGNTTRQKEWAGLDQ